MSSGCMNGCRMRILTAFCCLHFQIISMTDNKFVVFAGILGRGRSWVSLQLLLVILLFCLPFDSDAKCLQNRSGYNFMCNFCVNFDIFAEPSNFACG